MIKELGIVFYGGPCCGADATCPAGVKRLVIPVGGLVAIYVWADRSAQGGWVFEFRGFLPQQPVAGAG